METLGRLELDIGAVKESIKCVRDTFNDIQRSLETVCSDLKELRSDQEVLKENKKLKEELAATKAEVMELKQHSRLKNLEIRGIPFVTNEKLEEHVQTLTAKLGISVEKSEIDLIHRVPSKDKAKPNILMKFVSRSSRNKVLQASKKNRVTTSDFGFQETDAVYINEHLCPEKKKFCLERQQFAQRKTVEVLLGTARKISGTKN
ncbi:hypothetical protein HPB48_017513 [Haemaphysalis longicornis]|uniref:Uncharacterized protein n=1 Tax=Haemaphysalis longicornis TaxID=44386 RepID=A0A9J6GVZ7_HAELO|nr:hypothetical protein HPB48_017513 [Haemaphysalis longicornis]